MTKILKDHTPTKYMPYMDDVAVKGPKTNYSREEILPRVRCFVAEHLWNIDAVLADIERAGCTASGHKSN